MGVYMASAPTATANSVSAATFLALPQDETPCLYIGGGVTWQHPRLEPVTEHGRG